MIGVQVALLDECCNINGKMQSTVGKRRGSIMESAEDVWIFLG